VVAGRLIDANLCALVRTDNEALVDSAPVLVALVSAVSIAVAHQVVLDALPVVTRELVGGAGRRSGYWQQRVGQSRLMLSVPTNVTYRNIYKGFLEIVYCLNIDQNKTLEGIA